MIKRLKQKVQWVLLDENQNEVHHFSKENCFINEKGYPAIKSVTFDEKFVGQTLYMTPYIYEPDINTSTKIVIIQEKSGLVANWSKDKKSIELILYTRIINKTNSYPLSEKQINNAISKITSQTNSSFSGTSSEVITIKSFKVIENQNSKVSLTFIDTISVITNDPFDSAGSYGYVFENDFGNPYTGTVYISSRKNFEHGESDRIGKINDGEVGQTGTHEIGHLCGLYHLENSPIDRIKNSKGENNLMKEFATPNDMLILPEQRTRILHVIK